MASFVATYQASGGQARQLRVEANDLLDAKRQLRRRGILTRLNRQTCNWINCQIILWRHVPHRRISARIKLTHSGCLVATRVITSIK
jgi:hypothetical protein